MAVHERFTVPSSFTLAGGNVPVLPENVARINHDGDREVAIRQSGVQDRAKVCHRRQSKRLHRAKLCRFFNGGHENEFLPGELALGTSIC